MSLWINDGFKDWRRFSNLLRTAFEEWTLAIRVNNMNEWNDEWIRGYMKLRFCMKFACIVLIVDRVSET